MATTINTSVDKHRVDWIKFRHEIGENGHRHTKRPTTTKMWQHHKLTHCKRNYKVKICSEFNESWENSVKLCDRNIVHALTICLVNLCKRFSEFYVRLIEMRLQYILLCCLLVWKFHLTLARPSDNSLASNNHASVVSWPKKKRE